ncbi:MAG: polysaccharide biosynthesis/export family protein [Spirochaetales bacterium]|nr:polysaccharide biosynthesis/export family protein [Spirochaetales bacterium]
MINGILFFLCILFIALTGTGCQDIPIVNPSVKTTSGTGYVVPPAEPKPYVLQAGDTIEIQFYYHPSLNKKVTIRPDGKITLQLIDDVRAAGLQPEELDEYLTSVYSQKIKNPDISVIVQEFAAFFIYVGGEVLQPGAISLRGGLTCLQAIIKAGGFTDWAFKKEVVVLRNKGTARPEIIILDLTAEFKEGGVNNDIILEPKDIIFIPRKVTFE